MSSFLQSLKQFGHNKAPNHSQETTIVPLDGSQSARLVNMRLHREGETTSEIELADASYRWYGLLRAAEKSTQRVTSEHNISSWFLKVQDSFKPDWVHTEKGGVASVHEQVADSYKEATVQNFSSYQVKPEHLLEKVEKNWSAACERKVLFEEKTSFWSGDDSEYLEQRDQRKLH
jgi:hypothetical protein